MRISTRRQPIIVVSLILLSLLFNCHFAGGQSPEETNASASQIGKTVAQFELKGVDGRVWSRRDKPSQFLVVAFLGTECPLVKLYAARLESMFQEFKSKSVGFVAINSNQQDSIAEIQHFVRTYKLSFPVLKDPGNRVADLFNAERTPEIFVLDSDGSVVYHGVIDDQYSYGVQQAVAKNHYLRDALQALVNGRTPRVSQSECVGCIIGRKSVADETSDVTFSNQISRLLNEHCVNCHRTGEIAPFALTDYDDVAGWAEMIREVVRQQRMPPWHADAPAGHFKNDIRLTDQEKQLIYDWVAAGAPEGDRAKLPEPKSFSDGWQIGKPDQIIKMDDRPFRVKATGAVPYQYFEVDPGFDEDKWIKAAECRPGNRAVVHHIIVGVNGEGEFGRGEGVHDRLQSEWIAATAPGAPPMVLPEGYAKFVPAGSKLIFQMHYTPNGKRTSDLSQIGLIFADPAEVKKRVLTLMTFNDSLEIPAGEDNYRIAAFYKFAQDVELMSMFPHMHYRGKSFTYEFKKPGQTFEKMLDVPNYDFHWQNAYELTEYQTIPKGTRLRCVAHFDNSDGNLANPDPTKTVTWGNQTWDEMMIGYFNVAIENK